MAHEQDQPRLLHEHRLPTEVWAGHDVHAALIPLHRDAVGNERPSGVPPAGDFQQCVPAIHYPEAVLRLPDQRGLGVVVFSCHCSEGHEHVHLGHRVARLGHERGVLEEFLDQTPQDGCFQVSDAEDQVSDLLIESMCCLALVVEHRMGLGVVLESEVVVWEHLLQVRRQASLGLHEISVLRQILDGEHRCAVLAGEVDGNA
mmetsp:Transcript_20082/g.56451  ORF Transcript_20082/g.56451 Transcript_20082/m.56451 type:complete len:202 (-) Transcript_20082:1151-1756(-)